MTRSIQRKFSVSIIFLSFCIFICTCNKQPYNKKVNNLPPDTFITDVKLTPADVNSIEYNVTVQYNGLDSDSRIKYFEYHWGDGEWQRVEAECTNTSKVFSFESRDIEYEFYVRCIDEFDAVDNSPAYRLIDGTMIENERPSITINGPEQGTEISAYTFIRIFVNDISGKVKHVDWKLDTEGTWETVFFDSCDYSAEIELWNMTEGFHTFYVKAVDNFGDESDVQNITFYVRTNNYFTPFVTLEPREGPLFLQPLGGPGDWPEISITADAGFYHCDIDFYRYSTDKGSTWITSEKPVNFIWTGFDRDAAEILLMYKIFDKAGNVAENTIMYNPVDVPSWGPDILLINGNFYGEVSGTTECIYTLSDGSSTNGQNFIYWEGNFGNYDYVNDFIISNLADEGNYISYGDNIPIPLINMFKVIIGLFDDSEGSLLTYDNSINNLITWLFIRDDFRLILNAEDFDKHFWEQIQSYFEYSEESKTNCFKVSGDSTGNVNVYEEWNEGSYPIYATQAGIEAGMPEIIYPSGSYSGGIRCVNANWEGWGKGYTPYLKDANGNICGFSRDDENGLPKLVLLCWKNNNHIFEDTKAVYDAFYKLWGY